MAADTDSSPIYVAESGTSAPPAEFSAEERRILDRINQKVAGSRSVGEAIDFLFESTRSFSPCDRISVALLDEDGERLASYYVRAIYEPVCLKKGFAQELRGSSLEAVIRSGTPRILNDLPAYLAAHPQSVSTRLIVSEGVRSSLTCPLTVEGRIVGVMFRSSRTPSAYGENQIRLHQAVAERLSQAVEKVCLIERLTAANRAYTEMLGFVSHEMKGPLAGLVMEGKILLDGYYGPLASQPAEKVGKMVVRAEYLLGLIRDYLDLAAIDGGDLKLRLKPDVGVVAAVIRPAINLAAPALQENGMTLAQQMPAEEPVLTCDPDLLRIVVVNLLGNAAKYGKRGGEVRLHLACDATTLTLSVWNEGTGFRGLDRSALFRRFSRLPTPEFERIKGTGLGLYTAWRIVQMHGGRIRAESNYGQWAEFVVEIPARGTHDGLAEAVEL